MLINGGLHKDQRGKLTYANDFDFKDVKRFYIVENAGKTFRGWHGHKKEGKYVFVVKGSAKVGVVNMKTKKINRHLLVEEKPQILYIPPGNYNGFRTLRKNTKVMFFSTSTLDESLEDDYREDEGKWKL